MSSAGPHSNAAGPALRESELRLIAADAVGPSPWRNGGGSTRELWLEPGLGEDEGWALRVSVAEIESDGPFSEFEGIDRWFAVLRGEGVTLRWPSRERSLGPESGPVCFDGAQAPDCSLHSGATTDLNLMCRRSAGQGQMLRTPSHPVWQSSAPWRALFTVCAATLEINGEWATQLAPMSLLVSRSAVGETWSLRAPEPPQSFWLAFTPNSRA